MQSILFERWTFIAVWFQKEAHLKRQFILNYFPYDNGVEMVKFFISKATSQVSTLMKTQNNFSSTEIQAKHSCGDA